MGWKSVSVGGAASWADYTPVWTADTGTTSVGNGTLAGRWVRTGNTVHYKIKLTWGSTTSATGGGWSFTLPVTSAGSETDVASVRMIDSGTLNWTGISINTSTTLIFPLTSVGGGISGSSPFTWTTSDHIVISGTYEAA